jgi:hypothetical protein
LRSTSAEYRSAAERTMAHERALQRAMPATPVASQVGQVVEETPVLVEPATPQPIVEVVLGSPVPTTEPDAEPPSKDALIASLRNQLSDRQAREDMYKEKITGLYQTLAALERQHGPLITLHSEHERQSAPLNLPSNFGSLLGSASFVGSSAPQLGSIAIATGSTMSPLAMFGRSPPSGGRPMLSGRSEANQVNSQSSSAAAVRAALAGVLGPQVQRLSSSRSTVPSQMVSVGPTPSASMTLPISPSQPTRASSTTSSSFMSTRGFPLANVVTSASNVKTMHRMQTSPPLFTYPALETKAPTGFVLETKAPTSSTS